jgi:hypothetical protein
MVKHRYDAHTSRQISELVLREVISGFDPYSAQQRRTETYFVNSERLVSRIQHMRMAIKVSVTKVTAKVLRGIFPDLLSTSSHVRD